MNPYCFRNWSLLHWISSHRFNAHLSVFKVHVESERRNIHTFRNSDIQILYIIYNWTHIQVGLKKEHGKSFYSYDS